MFEQEAELPEKFRVQNKDPSRKCWQQMDQIQQLQLKDNEDDGKYRIQKKKHVIKKTGEKQKQMITNSYEQALLELRKKDTQFFNPFQVHNKIPIHLNLQLNRQKISLILQKGLQTDSDMDIGLKLLGMKRRRIIYKQNAVLHFKAMQIYLKTGQIAKWLITNHELLLQGKKTKYIVRKYKKSIN